MPERHHRKRAGGYCRDPRRKIQLHPDGRSDGGRLCHAVRRAQAGREGRYRALLAQERVQRVRAVGRGAVYFTEQRTRRRAAAAGACGCGGGARARAAHHGGAAHFARLLREHGGSCRRAQGVRPLRQDAARGRRARRVPEIRPRPRRGIRGRVCGYVGGRFAQDHAHAHAGRASERLRRAAAPLRGGGAGSLPHDQPVLSCDGVRRIRRSNISPSAAPRSPIRSSANLPSVRARLSKRGLSCYEGSKTLVLAVDFGGAGIAPKAAYEALERRGVYAELYDGGMCCSTFRRSRRRGISRAWSARCVPWRAQRRCAAAMPSPPNCRPPGERKFSFLAASAMPYEELPPLQAVGRVCARNAGVTPPCYPVAVAGEQLTAQAAELLASAKHTFGLREGKVAVLNIGGRKGRA